jgi:hypothetical protein
LEYREKNTVRKICPAFLILILAMCSFTVESFSAERHVSREWAGLGEFETFAQSLQAASDASRNGRSDQKQEALQAAFPVSLRTSEILAQALLKLESITLPRVRFNLIKASISLILYRFTESAKNGLRSRISIG